MANKRQFVTVPDFQYSGDYYPQIRARLRQRNRVNVPEITNEDPREPFMQAESAFSLMAHFNNVLLDMVANSLFLRTATLPESVKLILENINSSLLPAGPAQVDMVGKLSTTYSSAQRLLEAYRKFSTERSVDVPEMVFENPSALDLTARTDQLGYGYGVEFDRASSSTAVLSSIEPDVVYDSSGPFRSTDLNHYLNIDGSTIGNDVEDLRIVEVFDDVVAGQYRKARLADASFITESGLNWQIRKVSSDLAPSWNAGILTTPFAAPVNERDKLYIGHPDVMFDRVDVDIQTPGAPGFSGVWEFYDPTDSTTTPDNVAVGASTIMFDLTTLLGTADVRDALVEVTYIPTGATYRAFSTWSGLENIVTTNHLGQTATPSSEEGDYLVKCNWRPLPNLVDNTLTGSATWTKDEKMTFDLPQDQTNSWYKSNIYDQVAGENKEAFYIRYRIISTGGSFLSPQSVEIHQGGQYAIVTLVQGKTVEETIGSSNGEADQEFELTRKPYVLASAQIYVDEGSGDEEWTVFSTLSRSLSTDKHCIVEPQTDGSATLTFGDGVNGKIPQIGTNNIRAIYRIGADEDGNIGANTLTVNRDGVGVFTEVWNPRQGQYWIEADWASEEALEAAKERGPRLLRTMYRAVSATDCEVLAASFINVNNVRPVARAVAYEESFGSKTIELIVVGGGGAALGSTEKKELEEYFNGGTTYGYGGILVANTNLTVTNYTPSIIPLTVRVEAYPVITEEMVMNLLSSLLSPTAVHSNGRSYVWRFGQDVPLSKIAAEIFNLSPENIFDVDFTSPTSDIQLASRELPVFDYVNSQVIIVQPSFAS